MPAATVIDGGFGIPLRDLVKAVRITAAGKRVRQLFVEGRSDIDPAAGWERLRKDELYDVDILRMIFRVSDDPVDAEIETIDISFCRRIGKVEVRSAIAEGLFAERGLIIFICVWPKMEPDKGQRVGGAIGIFYADEAVEGMFYVVERDIDLVVDLLLPILLGGELRAAGGEEEKADRKMEMWGWFQRC